MHCVHMEQKSGLMTAHEFLLHKCSLGTIVLTTNLFGLSIRMLLTSGTKKFSVGPGLTEFRID